jgi:quercetin dioxygenase-like cupin family protein
MIKTFPIGPNKYYKMDLFIIPRSDVFLAHGFSPSISARHFGEHGAGRASFVESVSTIHIGDKDHLPAGAPNVSLSGWRVTVLELTFPPSFMSAKHRHPGFVLGYVLEGEFRFHMEGEQETVLAPGDVFYEPPGRVHLPSGSGSATRPARVLAFAFTEKGKELVMPA